MMKRMKIGKMMIAVLCIMMFCMGCGSAKEDAESSAQEESAGEDLLEEPAVMEGTIEPAKDLQESDITVPEYLQGEETSSFSKAEDTEESEDATVYHLSGEEQSETAQKIATEIEDSVNEVLSNKEYYPNVTAISVNEECTEFNVTFSSQNLSLYENTLQMSLCVVGNKFQLYQGKSEDELMTVVNYIDGSTGEVFFTMNSSDIE